MRHVYRYKRRKHKHRAAQIRRIHYFLSENGSMSASATIPSHTLPSNKLASNKLANNKVNNKANHKKS